MSRFEYIPIKPLSVNEAWQGRRFKTPKYKHYQRSVLLMLPKFKLPEPPYKLTLEFGFSSRASDWDNPVKPIQDILQKKYGFDDKLIHEALVRKKITKKGKEYIKWKLEHFDEL